MPQGFIQLAAFRFPKGTKQLNNGNVALCFTGLSQPLQHVGQLRESFALRSRQCVLDLRPSPGMAATTFKS